MIFGFLLWNRLRIIRKQKVIIEAEKLKSDHANEQLRNLDETKSRFFTNISHELRTPLSLILGPISQFLESFPKAEQEQVQKLLMIQRNAQSLLNLVEELLEISRLDAGKAKLQEKNIAFYPFCRRLFGAFESSVDYKQIDYQLHYEVSPDLHLQVDQNKLEKIINNLISNALKFSEPQTTVEMYVGKQNGQMLIQVKDRGRGIAPEDLPHVFERYFQTNRSDLAIEGGTGIGLSLAKELAHLMKGDLTVESEWGKGSTFSLTFPYKEGPSHKILQIDEKEVFPIEQDQLIPLSNPNRPKILLVEDNLDMQQLIQSLLKDDFDYIQARDGQEAWELLEQNHPSIQDVSLILSDIMMPRMDGYALLEKIKSHESWKRKPVIMLTARGAEADKLTALRMGVDDYLTKPFSPKELKARLHNLISNYQARKAFLVEEEQNQVLSAADQIAQVDLNWLQELEKIILEAIAKGTKLTAIYVADQVAMSERQLFRKIKALTGLSVNKYIQEIKLQKARSLLEEKVYRTISEVAYASGFNTPGYFTTVFEKHFGKRPGEYLA